MTISAFLAGENPRISLTLSVAACAITTLALTIITTPLAWSIILIAGTILAMIPVVTVLRARRIKNQETRNAELIPYKNKILNCDMVFDNEHAASEKYHKLRERLNDPSFPLNLTFEKIDELIKLYPRS